MIAPWVQQHLETIGAWNSDGVSRTARIRRCQHCPTWTVVGLDADRCAGAVVASCDPLSPLGEALAILAGRSTYAVRRRGFRLELDHRSRWDIGGAPAGTRDYDVVTDHVCGAPPLPTVPSRLPSLRPQELPDEAPF